MYNRFHAQIAHSINFIVHKYNNIFHVKCFSIENM